jgi:7-cyano-7-deazaguanine synthase
LAGARRGKTRQAVILLSGGLDSAAAGWWAVRKGLRLHALTVNYGQRHAAELTAAGKVAAHLGVKEHAILSVNLSLFGGSALTDPALSVPKCRSMRHIGQGVPVTYVPARNTVFLSLALAFAEARDTQDIIIGANVLDYSGYPDCRPAFLNAFARLANLGTKAGAEGKRFRVHTPLLKMTKAQIIRRGLKWGADFSLTSSCYDPSAQGNARRQSFLACGRCDACSLRRKGFAELGLTDPVPYADFKPARGN